MLDFTIHDKDGLILRTGTCQEAVYEKLANDGEYIILAQSNCLSDYILNGEIKKHTAEELAIKNNLPEGFIWKMPERMAVDMRGIDDARAQAWERIKQRRAEEECKPFSCNGAVYDGNAASTQRISRNAMHAMSNHDFSIDWTLADNTAATLDAAGMIAVDAALTARNAAVFDTARLLREQINTCTDKALLDALQWPEVE